jgi:hypothetical protein
MKKQVNSRKSEILVVQSMYWDWTVWSPNFPLRSGHPNDKLNIGFLIKVIGMDVIFQTKLTALNLEL